MSLSKQVTIAWAVAAGWAGFIFYMFAQNGTELSNLDGILGEIKRWAEGIQMVLFGPDADLISSTAHFLEYTVLGALPFCSIALTAWQKPDGKLCEKPNRTSPRCRIMWSRTYHDPRPVPEPELGAGASDAPATP